MNAHQRYVANTIHALQPAEVADLVANPPSGRSSVLGVDAIHEMVTTYGDQETKTGWAALLADAAGTPRQKEWAATWALPISRMIFDLPAPDEQGDADVTSIERQAA